jgi:hypothetical protein
MSSTFHAVVRGPSFTGLGKRPDLTPAHQVDRPTGIGPAGARIAASRTNPVFGRSSLLCSTPLFARSNFIISTLAVRVTAPATISNLNSSLSLVGSIRSLARVRKNPRESHRWQALRLSFFAGAARPKEAQPRPKPDKAFVICKWHSLAPWGLSPLFY